MSRQGESPKVKRIRYQAQSADPVNPQEGDVFYSDGTPRAEGLWEYRNAAWEKVSNLNLDDLSDVDEAGLANRTFLRYDGSVWRPFSNDIGINSTVTGTDAYISDNFTNAKVIRLTDSGLVSVAQIISYYGNQRIILSNQTGNSITIKNETGPTPSREILTGTGGDLVLQAGQSLTLYYDLGNPKWHVVGISSDSPAPKTAFLKDVKSNGTSGGGISTTPTERVLNTITGDSSFVTLTNGTTGTDGTATRFTLQPGTYLIEDGSFQAYRANNHQAVLVNVTDASDEIYGSSEFADQAFDVQNSSKLSGTVTIASTKTFTVEHTSTRTQAGNGFGIAAGIGTNLEVFGQLKITKVL